MSPADLLRHAALAVQNDSSIYFANILNAHSNQTVALNASHALNEYLKFPNGNWFEWQDRYKPRHVVMTLRAAANAMESSSAPKTPNTSPEARVI